MLNVSHAARHACRRLTPALAAALCFAAFAAPAQAADSCRASAARATVPGAATVEPVAANAASSRCQTDTATVADVAPVGPLQLTAPHADTRRESRIIAASVQVAEAKLTLGDAPISVGAVRAGQLVSCAGTRSTTTGFSRVDDLIVNGTPVDVIADRPLDVQVGPVRVRANQVTPAGRTALILDAGDAQVVLGEALASGDACPATGTGDSRGPGGTPGGGAQICPDGATYDSARNVCVIAEPGTAPPAGAPQGSVAGVVVGKPYEGPRGGTVVTLADARQRAKSGTLPDSACLNGSGPDFVVLGTGKADRITGASTPDRILTLGGNDQVSSGLGDDCVDGGAGNDRLTGDRGRDRLWGGTGSDRLGGSQDDDRLYGQSGADVLQGADGKDRLSGGAGKDAVNGGSATDVLYGGPGDDTIHTGYGRDTVSAGAGRDDVNASTAGPASRRLRGGAGRDKLRINRNERRRQRGFERVYVIR